MRASDRIFLGLCVALVVAGPVMAVQEMLKARQAEGVGLVIETNRAPTDLDVGFRIAWRGALFVGILALDVMGSLVLLRVGKQPRVRAVSGRLVGLLVGGLAALDVAFLLDGKFLADAPYALRALVVVWLYPVGALVAAGAAMRLDEVEALLGGARA